ncbi:pH-response regulator protein palA/RIM20 [Pyricularia oryzae 70-15]|uniref:pH-response regulator protein palA/RIM20 n=3 Tax=Pyricularia oryzae TaxID=318829 RepID=PALA_PYRO7|nr:pH-response regulator protein palA/RIM20 [Pyricularia oryzae 70-15]Q51NJ3.1 RecName: Full=pH-response regulator protein palA/RIM20 [Pyricularia oryzae 70-15]EHA48564.1 pH-response regulator protein palA/RIM20 [Pyricularia oryzae 70-15]ELQ43801.1 pH-response regulator protein palA/rim-20 [Pyricularia oryzae Y34]KAI7920776.1 pH-response regulator protein palA/RIM20 [Pyricularia oryzae]
MSSQSAYQLPISFRKSNQLSFAPAVRQYISNKYDQHPDMFRQDIEVIDALRRDAINVREPHTSGIRKLQAYAAQLVWISGKFPIDIGADFTWYPALGYNTDRPLVQNNLQYELLNVLYNLAALYCQLALSTNSNGDSNAIKTAANYFSHAAGVLSHMKTAVLPELRMPSPPEDMDEATLESLEQLMLAQCQECYWQKAVAEGYKDATIAKLAARASDLYNSAAEAAMKSEAISSAWIHHISAKHHHFAAAAQYRASLDCLEKRKYGEEIARLQDAVACANEGLREARGGYLKEGVAEDLRRLKMRAEEDLKRAEHDNDMLYLLPVPTKPELKILDRANLAVARIPAQVSAPVDHIGDEAEFGPALFSKLVPYAVHMAVSIYEERRDRLVNNNIIHELEVLTERMHEILSSLNLPGSLQALEKPLGLPGPLIQHAEEIRQADGINRIQRSFADIDKLRSSDIAVFEEGKSLLVTEEEEDQRLRRRHGTQRWARPESRQDPAGGQKLWAQVGEIEGYFASSTSSDGIVREKYLAIEDTLMVLSGSDRSLMDFVPSSRRTEIPESVKPALGRLRGAYNDVLRMESRRRKRVEALRERARSDDIKPDILRETGRLERAYPGTTLAAAHFDDFFERRLDSLYEDDLALLERETAEQEKCLNEVSRVNREFESQRRAAGADKAGGKEREAALQKLDSAFYKYKEIVSNVEVGRKFYNDLSKIVGTFRDTCRTWVAERRKDARSLEDEISMPPLGSLSLQQTPSQQSSQYYSQQQQQQPRSPPQEAHHSAYADTGSMPPQQPRPLPAANAQQTWSQNMPIQFGGPPGTAQQTQPAQAGAKKPVGGTWDPSAGIRFG